MENAPLHLLLVEDEFIIAALLQEMLKDYGCEAFHAFTVQAAKEAIDQTRFDGALLDVNLSGEKVFPLLDVLRQRAIPFAFLTGYDPDTLLATHADCGVLPKPVTQSDLGAAVHCFRSRTPLPRARRSGFSQNKLRDA